MSDHDYDYESNWMDNDKVVIIGCHKCHGTEPKHDLFLCGQCGKHCCTNCAGAAGVEMEACPECEAQAAGQLARRIADADRQLRESRYQIAKLKGAMLRIEALDPAEQGHIEIARALGTAKGIAFIGRCLPEVAA